VLPNPIDQLLLRFGVIGDVFGPFLRRLFLQDIASLGFERLEIYIKRGVGFQQERQLVTTIRFMPVGRSFRPRISARGTGDPCRCDIYLSPSESVGGVKKRLVKTTSGCLLEFSIKMALYINIFYLTYRNWL
jgi:hypothetical protein